MNAYVALRVWIWTQAIVCFVKHVKQLLMYFQYVFLPPQAQKIN